jgi:hypothetical protein
VNEAIGDLFHIVIGGGKFFQLFLIIRDHVFNLLGLEVIQGRIDGFKEPVNFGLDIDVIFLPVMTEFIGKNDKVDGKLS